MKELFYDWFGLNDWLFGLLYALHVPFLGSVWAVIGYAYSYWAAGVVVMALLIRYVAVRHTADERQIESLSALLATLIVAFSVVWCLVYTFQSLSLMPRPWVVFPDLVSVQNALHWHEGLPASAPAIAVMLAVLLSGHVSVMVRPWLKVYAVLGCLLSVVSGVNWPVEVVAGAIVGWGGARIGQWYFRLGRRLVASAS